MHFVTENQNRLVGVEIFDEEDDLVHELGNVKPIKSNPFKSELVLS